LTLLRELQINSVPDNILRIHLLPSVNASIVESVGVTILGYRKWKSFFETRIRI
jgi:hypothetical protein